MAASVASVYETNVNSDAVPGNARGATAESIVAPCSADCGYKIVILAGMLNDFEQAGKEGE